MSLSYPRDLWYNSANRLSYSFTVVYLTPEPWEEPLIVEKVHPEGYMLLNGHHRWAAALKTGYASAISANKLSTV